MDKRTAERMSVFIVGLGAALALGMYALSGPVAGRSAAIGAALSAANWFLLCYLVGTVVRGSVRARPLLLGLVLFKMAALMGLTAVFVATGLVQPIPFMVGLSSLACGLLVGSFLYMARPAAGER